MKTSTSEQLFSQAQQYIPGGVNSPVRAFKAVGGKPLFIKSAKGAYLYDADGNQYIDLINSWGPMILGHAHPLIEETVAKALSSSLSFGAPTEQEVAMAQLITTLVPSIEKVRMVNSGTEACMSAIRLARGYTQREKIIKFEGCYHGHGDSFLIAAGSGLATTGVPNSPGVTQGTAKDTLLAPFNDLSAVAHLLEDHKDEVAAIILEPVAGNMGLVPPAPDFLQGLRKLCDEQKVLLIFDEVMTGFRLAQGGAQTLYGVQPDLTTLGKIIGGGLPVGAYGGKKEIMDFVSPVGPVYQAGTLSGNPIAMAAGYAMLKYLSEHPEIYQDLENKTQAITQGLQKGADKHGLPYPIQQVGSMYSLFFTKEKVQNFQEAQKADTEAFGQYFRAMLKRGIYLAPSAFESLFVSTALSTEDIEKISQAHEESLAELLVAK